MALAILRGTDIYEYDVSVSKPKEALEFLTMLKETYSTYQIQEVTAIPGLVSIDEAVLRQSDELLQVIATYQSRSQEKMGISLANGRKKQILLKRPNNTNPIFLHALVSTRNYPRLYFVCQKILEEVEKRESVALLKHIHLFLIARTIDPTEQYFVNELELLQEFLNFLTFHQRKIIPMTRQYPDLARAHENQYWVEELKIAFHEAVETAKIYQK